MAATSDEIVTEFTCELCKNLLVNPIYTGCCGVSFCQHCIEQSSKENSCPKCSLPNVSYVQDRRTERRMRETVIGCRNRNRGCVWMGKVFDLSAHLESEDGCPFALFPCPKNCGAMIERQELKAHLEAKCYISWTQCSHCKETIPTDSLEAHLDTVCPDCQLACPNKCSAIVKRSEAKEHLESCPAAVIHCPFSKAGCDEQMKRSDLQQHLAEGQVPHSLLAFNSVRKELDQMKEDLQQTQVHSQIQKREITKLQKALDASKVEVEAVKDRNMMLASNIAQELEFIAEQPHTAAVKNLAIACLKDQLKFLSNPLLLKLYPTGPSLTFRMPNYTQMKAANQPWVSLPFVVNNGYQLSITVHPNGDGEGHSTHISIYLHLVAGQYDDDLTWPLHFNDEIAITLMRQMPEPSKGRSRRGSEGSSEYVVQQRMRIMAHLIHRVNKQVGDMGLAFGYIALFCAQNNIDSTCLYKDSLVFQLTSIPGQRV